MARLSDAGKNQLPLPRFNLGGADCVGFGVVYGSGEAGGDEGDSGVAFILLQISPSRGGLVSRAQPVYPTDETQEHLATFNGGRPDHSFGVGGLEVIKRAFSLLKHILQKQRTEEQAPAILQKLS